MTHMYKEVDDELAHFECTGIKREKHFLVNPLVLECFHFMCSTCVINEKTNENRVQCGICKQYKKANPEINECTYHLNKRIQQNIPHLVDEVQRKCKLTLSKLKDAKAESKASIELQFESIQNKVEKKADSLKNEIDKLCKTISKDLQDQKELYLKKFDAIYHEVNDCENELANKEDLKFIDKNPENLDNLQLKLTILNKLNHALLTDFNKVHSTNAQRCIDMEFITYLDYNDKNKNSNFSAPMRFEQEIHIGAAANDLCVLGLDQLLVSDYTSKCLRIYNGYLELIRTVKKINKSDFEPFATATNGIDRIYISDNGINKILMTDLDFNLLSTYESNNLTNPRDCATRIIGYMFVIMKARAFMLSTKT